MESLFLYIELHEACRFKFVITPCKAEQPLWDMKLQEKEEQEQNIFFKMKVHKKCVEKTIYRWKVSVSSKLKVIWIIGQKKVFYSQRIPESNCGRKETIDLDILITYRNGDKNSYSLSE